MKLKNRLRTMLLSKLQDLLGETTGTKSVVDLIGLTEELGSGVRAKAQDDFAAIGLTLKSFYIGNLKPSEKSAEDLRANGHAGHGNLYPTASRGCVARCSPESKRGCGINSRNRSGNGIGEMLFRIPLKTFSAGSAAGSAGTNGIPDVMTPAESREDPASS